MDFVPNYPYAVNAGMHPHAVLQPRIVTQLVERNVLPFVEDVVADLTVVYNIVTPNIEEDPDAGFQIVENDEVKAAIEQIIEETKQGVTTIPV